MEVLEVKQEIGPHGEPVTAFYANGVGIIKVWTSYDPQDVRLVPDGEGGTLLKFTVDGGLGREERAHRVPNKMVGDDGGKSPMFSIGALSEATGQVVTLKRGISTHVGVLMPTSWRVSYRIGDGQAELDTINVPFKDSQIISLYWDKEHDRLCIEAHPF